MQGPDVRALNPKRPSGSNAPHTCDLHQVLAELDAPVSLNILHLHDTVVTGLVSSHVGAHQAVQPVLGATAADTNVGQHTVNTRSMHCQQSAKAAWDEGCGKSLVDAGNVVRAALSPVSLHCNCQQPLYMCAAQRRETALMCSPSASWCSALLQAGALTVLRCACLSAAWRPPPP